MLPQPPNAIRTAKARPYPAPAMPRRRLWKRSNMVILSCIGGLLALPGGISCLKGRPKPMIFPLFRRKADSIATLYGMIVTQARLPAFYSVYGVPDTVDGRFELILLHLFLVLRHSDRNDAERELGQQVFDLFCRDMDQNLREMGVGDLSVPKEMRRIGEAFYGRASAYEAALASGKAETLRIALARNVFGRESPEPEGAARLATYMLDAVTLLSGQDQGAIQRGNVFFPEPA
jgi:cytochrome b pre-mRNA-processing protein 3